MLKIGVLGLGHLGRIHVKCIKLVEAYELVGFFDPNDDAARWAEENYGLKRFDTPEELIAAVDVVDIVTPTVLHFELAKKVIDAGKHLFIEKPVTHTLEEAEYLSQQLKGTDLKVQVGHVERFNPALLALDEMALQPMFAEVHRLALFNPRGTDVSVVLDLMIHDLDIILKLMGTDVVDVQASGVAIVSPTSDIANARITFGSGAVVNVTASRISMKNMRKIRLFQPDAYLSLDFLKKQTEVIRLHEEAPEGVENLMTLETQNGQRFIELSMPEAPANNAIKEELESFAHSILNNKPSKVGLDDGLNALKLAYRIEEQIQAHLAKVKKTANVSK